MTTYEKVKQLLETDQMTKNDDLLLINSFARKHYGTANVQLNIVLTDIKSGLFPSFDTITRLRRKAQEMHPELRAEAYRGRQEMANDVALQMVTWDKSGQGILL